MDSRVFAVAIPLFLAFLVVEIRLARRRMRQNGDRLYRLHDSAASVSCGIGAQVLGALALTLPVAGYTAIYERARVATIVPSPLAWVVVLIAVDLGYWVY